MEQAFAFLTCVGRAKAPTPKSLVWFPFVGAVIGAVIGAVWWFSGRIWFPLVTPGIVIAADAALTGLLHYDGLVKATDALVPHMERARRLQVMREPQVGAYGVVAAIVIVMLRWTVLAALVPSVTLLAALWTASRTAMALAAYFVPYALADGTARPFAGKQAPIAGAAGAVIVIVLCVLGGEIKVALGAIACVAAFAAVILFSKKRVGGFTGEVLGAAALVGETVGLLVLQAKL